MLGIEGNIQSLSCILLGASYDFIMGLLIHTYTEVRILSCQGLSEKNILYFLSKQLRQIFNNLY